MWRWPSLYIWIARIRRRLGVYDKRGAAELRQIMRESGDLDTMLARLKERQKARKRRRSTPPE